MSLEKNIEKPYYEVVHAYCLTAEELKRASNLDVFVWKIGTVGYDENGETFIDYLPNHPDISGPALSLSKDTSSEPITGLEEAAQKIAERVNGHVEDDRYGFRVVLKQKISQNEFVTKYVKIFEQVFNRIICDGCIVAFYDNVPKKELEKSGLPRKKLKNLHSLVK